MVYAVIAVKVGSLNVYLQFVRVGVDGNHCTCDCSDVSLKFSASYADA
jgi:hypothetical protein